MFPVNFSEMINASSGWVGSLLLIAGIFLGIFLFWRAGRRELLESELLFDTLIIGLAGAFLGGRLVDFLVRSLLYGWSIKKLIFVNVYGGFNFWGALAGAGLAVLPFLKVRKVDPLKIFDIAAAPAAFAQMVVLLGVFRPLAFYSPLFYLVLFWVLKRLETQKRHSGFFAGFYLSSIAIFSLLVYTLAGLPLIFSEQFWQIVLAVMFFIVGGLFWYFRAGRIPGSDLKSFFALALLTILRIRRMVTSVDEAGKFAKSLLFLPIYLVRLLYLLLKLVSGQFALSLVDVFRAFKGRR